MQPVYAVSGGVSKFLHRLHRNLLALLLGVGTAHLAHARLTTSWSAGDGDAQRR